MSETIESSGGSAVSRRQFIGLNFAFAICGRPRLTRGPMIAMMADNSWVQKVMDAEYPTETFVSEHPTSSDLAILDMTFPITEAA